MIHQDNSASSQRERILAALRQGPVTTIFARRDLDIMMPTTRVHELRHREGCNIHTHWAHRPTDAGVLHRVAEYVLLKQ